MSRVAVEIPVCLLLPHPIYIYHAIANNAIQTPPQVEHGVLSNVENANGIVTLLKELGCENETRVAVAATHCLRRVFAQLLDPIKNPQVHADWYLIEHIGDLFSFSFLPPAAGTHLYPLPK